jgi:aryl-alcohol dehydrogenase-like predicted oxidoreductase
MRLDESASREVVHAALDAGINFFDTADSYGNRGGSEECLGKALKSRRSEAVIATKFGNPMADGVLMRGASRRYIMTAIDASLRRLATDWIDLYQLHRPDPSTPIDETLRALDDLVSSGKVRYVGCSNMAGWQVVDAHWTAKSRGGIGLSSCQDEYSLLARGAERELLPALRSQGLGFLPFFPLANGLLSGKYTASTRAPADSRLVNDTRLANRYLTPANLAITEKLSAFCAKRDRTLLELAMSWLASQSVVSSIIAGATSVAQVEQNARAAAWKLGAEDLAEIEAITSSKAVE